MDGVDGHQRAAVARYGAEPTPGLHALGHERARLARFALDRLDAT